MATHLGLRDIISLSGLFTGGEVLKNPGKTVHKTGGVAKTNWVIMDQLI